MLQARRVRSEAFAPAQIITLPPTHEASVRPRLSWGVRLFLLAALSSGFVSMRATGWITVSDVLLIACGMVVLIGMLTGRFVWGERRYTSLWLALVWLIMMGTVASATRSTSSIATLGVGIRIFVVVFGVPALALILLRNERSLAASAAAIAIGGGAQGAAATLQMFGIQVGLFGRAQYGRYTGFAQHPNDLGASAAIALPLAAAAAYYYLRNRKIGLGLLCVAASGLCVQAMILSGSGSALGGAIAGLLLAVMATQRRGGSRLVAAMLAVGCAAIVAITLTNMATDAGSGSDSGIKSPSRRLREITESGGTASVRLDTVRVAWRDILDSPLVGVGFSTKDLRTVKGLPVHSMPLLAWHGGGFFVLIGFLGVIWLTLRILRRKIRSSTGEYRLLFAGVLGSTAAMLVNGLAQPFLYKRYGWIPVALAFGGEAIKRR